MLLTATRFEGVTVRIPQRLAAVLGDELTAVDEARLRSLVGLREGDDLDVKAERYGTSDSDKRELCADVAAFANARGGLIVIGATERNEVVDALAPVHTSGEELRILSILANSIVPPTQVDVHIVPASTAGFGYVLIAVAASVRAPHAVAKEQDLRYPVRDGSHKRWMREPEVADRYRNRFLSAASRLERTAAVHASVQRLIDPATEDAWLILSAAPDNAGRLSVNVAGTKAVQTWLNDFATRVPDATALGEISTPITTGFRRYVAGDGKLRADRLARSTAIELHADGSTALAIVVGFSTHDRFDDAAAADRRPVISDSLLAMTCLLQLAVAGGHAERAGSSGELTVLASIYSSLPLILGHHRHYGLVGQIGRVVLVPEVERAAHTFSLLDLGPGPSLVAAGSLVASDLVATFGGGECLQLSPEGQIRQKYVEPQLRDRISGWVTRFGVEITDDEL